MNSTYRNERKLNLVLGNITNQLTNNIKFSVFDGLEDMKN